MFSRTPRFGKGILVAALLSTSTLFPVQAAEAGAGNGVVKLVSSSYGKLSAHWWQYVTSFPADQDPRAEQGTIDCVRNQNGPILFLVGSEGETLARTCTIPKKPLFFPVLNFLFDNAPGDPPASVDEKRAILDGVLSDTEPGVIAGPDVPGTRACGLEVTLDGEPVEYEAALARAQSPPFELITGSDGNPPDANDPKAISDGFWTLLPALSRGEHTLRIQAQVCEFDSTETHPFFPPVDVTYHLTVQ